MDSIGENWSCFNPHHFFSRQTNIHMSQTVHRTSDPTAPSLYFLQNSSLSFLFFSNRSNFLLFSLPQVVAKSSPHCACPKTHLLPVLSELCSGVVTTSSWTRFDTPELLQRSRNSCWSLWSCWKLPAAIFLAAAPRPSNAEKSSLFHPWNKVSSLFGAWAKPKQVFGQICWS